jgi:hypothetical protein
MAELHVPLSVLDLCPVPTGASTADALRRTVDLARHTEKWGYRRVDEIMVTTSTYAHADRLESYRLLAGAVGAETVPVEK